MNEGRKSHLGTQSEVHLNFSMGFYMKFLLTTYARFIRAVSKSSERQLSLNVLSS